MARSKLGPNVSKTHQVSPTGEVSYVPGTGTPTTIALGNPAAGSDYVLQTVPAGKVWRIFSFSGVLTADAIVANRLPLYRFQNVTNNQFFEGLMTDINQTANQAFDYSGAGRGEIKTNSLAGTRTFPMPDFPLLPGFDLVFTTVNLQAGDNWGAGFLYVEEFDE